MGELKPFSAGKTYTCKHTHTHTLPSVRSHPEGCGTPYLLS